LVDNRDLFIPLAFDAPVRGAPVGILSSRLIWKNMVGLPDGEETLKICITV